MPVLPLRFVLAVHAAPVERTMVFADGSQNGIIGTVWTAAARRRFVVRRGTHYPISAKSTVKSSITWTRSERKRITV